MKKKTCSLCEARAGLEGHHLLPVAAGGTRNHGLIWLCRDCHVRAHHKFGKGDAYKGPTSFVKFVLAMKAEITT